jgi:lipopolysaccharide biosynthesis glycosyltransferase
VINSKSDSNKIPILLCFDRKYARYAAVATYSAYKSTKANLIFYWLSTVDCEEIAENLKKHLQKLGIQIVLLAHNLQDIKDWKTGFHFTTANYLRIFAPNLLKNVDKVIYIDCDTLVLTDLSNLYNYPLGDFHFAGVIDEFGGRSSKILRNTNDKYINSGVLLMDFKGLRNNDFLGHLKILYKQYESQIIWADQCLINKYAEGKKVLLDPKWNRQIFAQNVKQIEFINLIKPQFSSILHFVGDTKPWQIWCNPAIAEFWWSYAQDLQIDELKPTQISTVEQLVSYSNALHLNGRYEEASIIKTQAIQALYKHIVEPKLKPDYK